MGGCPPCFSLLRFNLPVCLCVFVLRSSRTLPSNRSRIVQYLKMAPSNDPAIVPAAVNSSSAHNTVHNFRKSFLPRPDSGFELTALGERRYGFTPWAEEDTAESVVSDGWEFLQLPTAPIGPSGPADEPRIIDV